MKKRFQILFNRKSETPSATGNSFSYSDNQLFGVLKKPQWSISAGKLHGEFGTNGFGKPVRWRTADGDERNVANAACQRMQDIKLQVLPKDIKDLVWSRAFEVLDTFDYNNPLSPNYGKCIPFGQN